MFKKLNLLQLREKFEGKDKKRQRKNTDSVDSSSSKDSKRRSRRRKRDTSGSSRHSSRKRQLEKSGNSNSKPKKSRTPPQSPQVTRTRTTRKTPKRLENQARPQNLTHDPKFVNSDSPTQTLRFRDRIPIINTKILNYMINSKQKTPGNSRDDTKTKNIKVIDKPDKKRKVEKKEKKSSFKRGSSEPSVKRLKQDSSPTRTNSGSISLSRAFRRQIRSQVWNMSKNAIKRNEHWRKVLEDNKINVDMIKPKGIDSTLINVDALGIENRLAKTTIKWLLKP